MHKQGATTKSLLDHARDERHSAANVYRTAPTIPASDFNQGNNDDAAQQLLAFTSCKPIVCISRKLQRMHRKRLTMAASYEVGRKRARCVHLLEANRVPMLGQRSDYICGATLQAHAAGTYKYDMSDDICILCHYACMPRLEPTCLALGVHETGWKKWLCTA